jgi:hypothetical protein
VRAAAIISLRVTSTSPSRRSTCARSGAEPRLRGRAHPRRSPQRGDPFPRRGRAVATTARDGITIGSVDDAHQRQFC